MSVLADIAEVGRKEGRTEQVCAALSVVLRKGKEWVGKQTRQQRASDHGQGNIPKERPIPSTQERFTKGNRAGGSIWEAMGGRGVALHGRPPGSGRLPGLGEHPFISQRPGSRMAKGAPSQRGQESVPASNPSLFSSRPKHMRVLGQNVCTRLSPAAALLRCAFSPCLLASFSSAFCLLHVYMREKRGKKGTSL
jgi:hypothetical protein